MPVPIWCLYQVSVITVFTVFRLLTDFVCLYNYEFWLSLCKIVRSSIILLLPLLNALSMFMLFICDNMWSFWVEANLCKVFFFVCLYMHCLWRSSYQEGRWDPINRFRPSTFVRLSKTRIWISNVICRCPLCDQWVMVNWKVTARYFTITV